MRTVGEGEREKEMRGREERKRMERKRRREVHVEPCNNTIYDGTNQNVTTCH